MVLLIKSGDDGYITLAKPPPSPGSKMLPNLYTVSIRGALKMKLGFLRRILKKLAKLLRISI